MRHGTKAVLVRTLAATLAAVFCLAAMGLPATAEASHRNSSLRRKIDRLDDDPVKELPIPILFGIKPGDFLPDFGDPRSGGRTHEGQDILAPPGALVVSPTEAVVTSIGRGDRSGNYVYTANPGRETFRYMHLDEVADDLDVGDELDPGGLIGFVGNTGNAAGGPAHLHFEIRDRRAIDPYPRLTGIFDLEDKVEFLAEILDDASASEERELVSFVVTHYTAELLAARAQSIDLPEKVAAALALPNIPVAAAAASSAPPVIDLTLGARGNDVIWLQKFLITESVGPAATNLASVGATGYFGILTRAALAEYQAANSIFPSVGYYGPLTRAHISARLLSLNLQL